MQSITGFSRDNCEWFIKVTKKAVKWHMLWTMFCVTVTVFDFQTLIQNTTAWSGISVGAMAVTSLWSFIFLLESFSDLRSEKLRYRYLTELHDTQQASTEKEQYLLAKRYYEQLKESLERSNGQNTQ